MSKLTEKLNKNSGSLAMVALAGVIWIATELGAFGSVDSESLLPVIPLGLILGAVAYAGYKAWVNRK